MFLRLVFFVIFLGIGSITFSFGILFLFFCCLCFIFIFFFLRQKPAYELRIRDGSSDVCSSDLQSMLVLMYAFIGFEFRLIAAGDTRNARTAIPRTLVGTVVAMSVAYTLIQLVIVSVGSDLGTSEAPLVDVAKRLMGQIGRAHV